MYKKIIFTIFILIIAIALIGLFLIGAFSEKERGNAIDEEINELKEEARKIGISNDILEERIAYFQSSDFQETEAKKKLNLKKEGEEVVVIKSVNKLDESEIVEEEIIPEKQDVTPNYKKWWNYLFNHYEK